MKRKPFVECKLFSIYTREDEDIAREGGANRLVLIGGTALELVLNEHGIKHDRVRSKNDIDFLCYEKYDRITGFLDKMTELGLQTKSKEGDSVLHLSKEGLEVDILFELDTYLKSRVKNIGGYLVMDEVGQFCMKFNRYVTNARPQDEKDLLLMLKLIETKKLENTLERLLSMRYPEEEDKINHLIEKYNKWNEKSNKR